MANQDDEFSINKRNVPLDEAIDRWLQQNGPGPKTRGRNLDPGITHVNDDRGGRKGVPLPLINTPRTDASQGPFKELILGKLGREISFPQMPVLDVFDGMKAGLIKDAQAHADERIRGWMTEERVADFEGKSYDEVCLAINIRKFLAEAIDRTKSSDDPEVARWVTDHEEELLDPDRAGGSEAALREAMRKEGSTDAFINFVIDHADPHVSSPTRYSREKEIDRDLLKRSRYIESPKLGGFEDR